MTATLRRREVEEQQPLRVGRVNVDKIRFRAGNRSLGDLRELAESLRQEGVLQPLLLHRIGDVHEVLDGHRRLAAARLAGLRTVPAVIVAQRSQGDAINIMVATAMHTKGLDPAERAVAIRDLVGRHGWSVEDLAARWGVSPATVTRWRNCDEPLPAQAQAARPAQQRKQRPPRMVGIRRLVEVADRWEKQCGPDGLTLAEAAALLGELRALATAPEQQAVPRG